MQQQQAMIWREAMADDLPAIIALLADDVLGQGRESPDAAPYATAFAAMQKQSGNHQIVGVFQGRVMACYQLIVIPGLSLAGTCRAQLEGVRIARELRGQGRGRELLEDAENRARDAGASLMQLTSTNSREDAQRFYSNAGYVASHTGFKKTL